MSIRRWSACVAVVVLVTILAMPAWPQSTTAPSSQPNSRPATGPGSRPTSRPSSRPTSRPSSTSTSAPTTQRVDSPEQAHAQFMRGDYSWAADNYRRLLADANLRLQCAMGLAEAQAAQGQYTQSLETLKSISEIGEAEPTWRLDMADGLATLGQYEDALKHASVAVEKKPLWAPGLLAKGVLLETLGRKDEAVANYQTIQAVIDQPDHRRDARNLVAVGLILDRLTILTGKKASVQADNIFNNYLRWAYQEVDKTYWPAAIAAGTFALNKHRAEYADAEFQVAAKLNAHIPDVMVGQGVLLLGGMRFDQCLAKAEEALKINPNYDQAMLLKAACYMEWRKHRDAIAPLQAVLKINPRHIEALCELAAVHTCLNEPNEAQQYIDRVLAINPHSYELYDTIGHAMSGLRQFDKAETSFRKAMELAPEMSEPVTGLGLLYMQTGKEEQARQTLEKAHELDDYRADVINYLNVLSELKKFQVKETEHFIVKVEKDRDAVLLDQVAEYLEQMYAEVCSDCGFQPADKTLIEIFPTQKEFSMRISGRGWIPTVGASTGTVIALAAPTPEVQRTPLGTHNWAMVLRHEFTHTVTMAATHNRISHWFTEACAVWQQTDKASYENIRLLVDATRSGRLFKLQDLNWGFIAPKGPMDRPLAYAQSEWILEFIIARKGYETMPAMLKALGEGKTEPEVFEQIVGIPVDKFDAEFLIFARQKVKEWGYNPDPLPQLEPAAKAATENPKDANAQATHALALYLRGNLPAAGEAAKKALELDANNTRAMGVTCYVLLGQKKYDDAIVAADKLEEADHTSPVAPRVSAECYLNKEGDNAARAKAIKALELLQQRQPYDEYSYQQLARLYTTLGMPSQALPHLIHLQRHTLHNAKYSIQIAEIYHAMKQDSAALSYYQQALHINPYDASIYDAEIALLLGAKQYPKAIEAARIACLLAPDAAKSWTKLAIVRYRAAMAGDNHDLLLQARQDAQKALSIEANDDAQQILAKIDEALKETGGKPTP